MKPYPKYKDSGVEWLGMVPEGWDIGPLKYFVSCNDEVLSESTPSDYEFDYIDIGGVTLEAGIQAKNTYLFAHAPSRARRKVKQGDVIVSTVRTYLKAIAIVGEKESSCVVSTGFAVLRPKPNISTGYLGYLCQSPEFVNKVIVYSNGVSYPAINSNSLVSLNVQFPPLFEQQAIVEYLDRETAEMDALISEQEQLIELLKQKRQVLISETVCRGLDPNVPMKDSGVEWLGMVPEEWTLIRLKFVVENKLEYGANEAADSSDLSQPRYIRITDFDENGSLKKNTYKSLPYSKAEPYLLRKGDILFARSGATVGKTFIFRENEKQACFAGYLIRATPNDDIAPHFLYAYTKSNEYLDWKNSVIYQATIQNIGAEKYSNLPIPLPPLSEQQMIVEYLDRKTSELDALIADCEANIELIKQRRTSLISEVVTGKIDVRTAI